jgi:hypothetical protein
MRATPVITPCTLLLCLVLLGACRNPEGGDAAALGAAPAGRSGPAPVVTGTVLDARTGKPIAGALVRGPGGVEAKSDKSGRFVLRGLALGAAGELVGTTEAGLSGKNLLRPLESGLLEVVLHLR